MFEYARFTDRARKVMQLANQEAQRFNREYIATEHILLGLIKEDAGVAANVLKNLGLNLMKVRLEVERIVQSGPDKVMMGKLPQTPRAKKVIDFAIDEARKLNHSYVGTEHMLLGLLREEEGVAAQVLTNLGLKLEDVRCEVLRLLERGMPRKSFPFLLGKFCHKVLRLLGWRIPAENSSKVQSLPKPAQPCSESQRIHSLEQQLWNMRIVLGALVGALAGVLLLAQFGAVMGLLLGGLVAALGWRTVGVLAGGSVGVLLGCTHLPNDGGGLAGALLGALAGFLIAEIGEPPNGRGFLGLFCERGDRMSQIITAPVPTFPASVEAEPTPRRWTREEYYRMGDMGFFDGQRVELIEGEIMVLSPQKAEHWTTTDLVAELLRASFGSGYHVRMQGPIDFGPSSEPEPDIAVIVGTRSQYATHHPQTAALIVEVSESRLQYDRTRKASLYARAGIADYWIVNLVDKQLEVRRDPRPDPSQHYGHGYASVTTLVPPGAVNPLAAPQISLAVADLLP